jgi:hypothetical protein
MGGPFDILYVPRAVADSAKAPKKPGPKSVKAELHHPINSAPEFNRPIATQADSERTRKVRGRGLK